MRILRKILPLVIISVALYFFVNAIVENWESVRQISLQPNIFTILALLLFVAAIIVSGLLWGVVLNDISKENRISPREAVRVHLASWLLKYIPGQAGSYINKVAWGNKNDVSQKTISLSFLYENVLLLFASTLPALPLLLLLPSVDLNNSQLIPLLIAIPFVVVLNKRVFFGLVNYLSKKFRHKEIDSDRFISTKRLIKLQIWYLLPRVLNGAGFVMLTHSLFEVSPQMYLPLAAIYVLAGIIGILSIFVPSGIGVREAIIVAFVSVYFPIEQAVMIAIVSRFYATLADVGALGIYLYLNKWRIVQR